MSKLIDRRALVVAAAGLGVMGPSLLWPQKALAAATEVQMLNVHPEDRKKRMVFYPLITSVDAGSTVKFVAADKAHNSQSIEGMIPEGAEPWEGKINEEVEVTFEKPGVYGYKCLPHQALGMVGLIIVKGDGMTDNLEAAQAVQHRGRAKKVFEEIWAQVESENLLG